MRCPSCDRDKNKVYDSRDSWLLHPDSRQPVVTKKRRRECLMKRCGHRWSTYEVTGELLESNNKLFKLETLLTNIKELLNES